MRILIIVLLFILFVFGCSTDPIEKSPSPENVIQLPEYEGQGVAYGIQETREGRFWRTYQVSAGSTFRGLFWLLNQQPAENYLLTCLLDYRQVPCVFDGQQRFLYRLRLGGFEDLTVPFETPAVVQGLHDLALLAIAKPDVHDLSREYRFSTDFNYLYASRAVLLSGIKPWQAPVTEPAITGYELVSHTVPLEGIVVNREQEEILTAWLTQTVRPRETVDFNVHIGNDTGPPLTFAIMAFLDYRQVPLDGTEQWVTYVSLTTGARVTLAGQLIAPEESGIHEFMIVRAFDPYQMLEDFPHTANGSLTKFSDIVESSIRVAIIVENK